MNWAAVYLIKRAEAAMAPLGAQHGGAGLNLNLNSAPRAQLASTGVTPQPISGAMRANAAAPGYVKADKPPDPWAGWGEELTNFGVNAGTNLAMGLFMGGGGGQVASKVPKLPMGRR
jgi:hypothetical protein